MVGVDQLAEIIRAWAKTEPEVQRVWLFGSRIRGLTKAGGPVREDSDLDVAVEISASPAHPTLGRIIRLTGPWRRTLQEQLPVTVQLEIMDEQETPFVAAAVKECSLLIYERG